MTTDADRALLNGLGCDSYSEASDLALITLYREQAANEAYALGRIEGAKERQYASIAAQSEEAAQAWLLGGCGNRQADAIRALNTRKALGEQP